MEALDTAVLYTPGPDGSPGTFGATPIQLINGLRYAHAAVSLADGRVLLIGGYTNTPGQPLVPGIDLFDPRAPTKAADIAATLHEPRANPAAFALPTGEVFIGGGVDATGAAVTTAEWLDANLDYLGSEKVWPDACGAVAGQVFAPTEGGAVLAVRTGPATLGCSNVELVRPYGAPIQQAPPLQLGAGSSTPTSLTLFPGAQASPVLITQAGTLRWNPWTGAFTPLGPPAGAGSTLPTPTALSVSTGLALWLAEDGNVYALRFDTHGPYATDVEHGPYLVTDDEFTAPDRLLPLDAGFTVSSGATLANGATVWVSDETFAGVTTSVTFPVGGSAALVLRDPAGREVTCGAADVPPLGSVQVTRSGAVVTVSATGGTGGRCDGTLDAGARVAVGVRGPDGGTTMVRGLAVER